MLRMFTHQAPRDGRFLGWRWYVYDPTEEPQYSLALQLWRPVGDEGDGNFLLFHEQAFKIHNKFNCAQEFYIRDDVRVEIEMGDVIGWKMLGKANLRKRYIRNPYVDAKCSRNTMVGETATCAFRNKMWRFRFQGIYQHRKYMSSVVISLHHELPILE